MSTHNNNNNNNTNISKKLEGNKRERDYSFFLNCSVSSNKSKKFCDNSSLDANNFYKNLSFSVTEFDYFQLNMHRMKKLDNLNSTEMDCEDIEDDVVDPVDTEIQAILENPNPSLVDVMKGIASLLKKSNTTSKGVSSINKQLSNLSTRVDLNTKNINILSNNADLQNNIIMKNLENVNYLKQDKIDREIFISGFEKIPDDKIVVKELCKFYNMQQNAIKSYRSIPSKNVDGSLKAAFMNVEFCTKQDQIKLLKSVKEVGQPTLKALTNPSSPSQSSTANLQVLDGKKIKISRRLTAENRNVIGRLRVLLDEKKIAKVRFRNCFYELQPLKETKFLTIPSVEHLEHYQTS